MQFYRQCKLEKRKWDYNLECGTEIQTSWIPEEFAKVGHFVKLKQNDGPNLWSDGWKVVEVGTRAPEDQVLERSQDYKRTRKASDI